MSTLEPSKGDRGLVDNKSHALNQHVIKKKKEMFRNQVEEGAILQNS